MALSEKAKEDERGVVDHRCGCCCFYPQCLQSLASPVVYLICICILVFVQSMVVSGYSSAILTTIEHRYDLRSSEIGMIISGYDVSSMFTGIFVSYVGGHHHRTRWLGTGAIIMAIGSVSFSLPYFLGITYYANPNVNNAENDTTICNHSSISTVAPSEEDICDSQNPEQWVWATFIVAFLIIGIGASPIYCLGPTYLYDNVKPSKFPIYAGWYFKFYIIPNKLYGSHYKVVNRFIAYLML